MSEHFKIPCNLCNGDGVVLVPNGYEVAECPACKGDGFTRNYVMVHKDALDVLKRLDECLKHKGINCHNGLAPSINGGKGNCVTSCDKCIAFYIKTGRIITEEDLK